MAYRDLVPTALKWGGPTHIVAGILVAVAYVSHPHHETPAMISSSFWLWTHVLFVFSLLGGIFGLGHVWLGWELWKDATSTPKEEAIA